MKVKMLLLFVSLFLVACSTPPVEVEPMMDETQSAPTSEVEMAPDDTSDLFGEEEIEPSM